MQTISNCVVIAMLMHFVIAFNEVALTNWQDNLTSGATIVACRQDFHGALLMTAAPDSITIWSRQTDNSFAQPRHIAVNDTLLDATISWDGNHIASISLNSTKLLMVMNTKGTYTTNFTSYELEVQPTCLGWSYNSQVLLVGLTNGSIVAYTKQSSKGPFAQSQLINTSHTRIVDIAGMTSRFVSCGDADSTLNVYFYNRTTKLFELNQTIQGEGNCSALDLPLWENRIAVAQTNGDVYIYEADGNLSFSKKYSLVGAHSKSVKFVILADDASVLLTAGSEGTLSLWLEASNFSTPTNKSMDVLVGDWNSYRSQFVVGDAKGNVTVLDLQASNCYTQQVDPENPARCSCPEGKGWLRGNCNALECGDGAVDNGTNSSCTCKNSTRWHANLQRCVMKCSPVFFPNANGTMYELTSCFCNVNSYWSYSLGYCVPNCSAIAHATESVPTACNCSDQYSWDVTIGLCSFNCTKVQGSSGNNFNSTVCGCNDGLAWNFTAMTCSIPTKLNCSAVDYSNGLNIGSDACDCIDGYFWNSTRAGCIVDCTDIANATGNNALGLCNCSGNLAYVRSMRMCVSGVDCTAVVNSPKTNYNATHCECNAGFFYTNWSYIDRTVGVCRRKCSELSHTTNTTPVDFMECSCEEGYVWSSKVTQCKVACAEALHSNGGDDGKGGCYCIGYYYWDTASKQCIQRVKINHRPVWIAIVLGVMLSLVALLGLFSLIWEYHRGPISSDTANSYGATAETAQTLSFKPAVGFSEQNFKN